MSTAAIVTIIVAFIISIPIAIAIVKSVNNERYRQLESEVLNHLGYQSWEVARFYDDEIYVKSRRTLDKYDQVRYIKDNGISITDIWSKLASKERVRNALIDFLKDNQFKNRYTYDRLEYKIKELTTNACAYRVRVEYVSTAGNHLGTKAISFDKKDIKRFENDPSLLMSKTEYNKYIKEQQKEALENKRHNYYESVNAIIDFANDNRDKLFIASSVDEFDSLVAQLFDRTVNSISKIKSIDSDEWELIGTFIKNIKGQIDEIVSRNQRILEYYESLDFKKVKDSCEVLMHSQREFNEYIQEKADSISRLFGTRMVRNETVNEDEYKYVRPYKKTISPFTAEVSSTIFASAENSPLDYVVKYFYQNKANYPEQIQKLHLLVEELETLKEANNIIEQYKLQYQQYLVGVPQYILDEDESGFYSRLGFANIDEGALTVEYKFSYTSSGGMAKRTFAIPMTEETIVNLINALEGKLTSSAFSKEQRALMTSKLREQIKARDNYTCRCCGNSTHIEPNLLLEIDHIVPVSKGGYTVEENLQTLCWKCNRAKGDKLL